MRNLGVSGGKLVLLVLAVFAGAGAAASVVGGWFLAALVAVSSSLLWLRKTTRNEGDRFDAKEGWTQLRPGLGWHHLAAVGGNLPVLIFPVMAAARLGSHGSAEMTLTWMLGGFFFMVSPAVAAAVIASTSASPEVLGGRLRHAAGLIAVLLAVPLAVALVAPGLLLGLFGPGYAAGGETLLRLLALSAIPDAVTNLAVAGYRVQGRLKLVTFLNVGMAAVALIGTWMWLPSLGVAAAGAAWVLAQCLGVCLVSADRLLARKRAGA